jgi:ketosteroid isomerase-like protein
MSEENIEIIRRGYQHFVATGEFSPELTHPDFVWDMSTFQGWPEGQAYAGIEGAQEFMAEWLEAWDDWELVLEELHDADAKVVAIVRQRGRSKATGAAVDMHFAQVWTLQDRRTVLMQMYASPDEALEAAGLRD